MALRVGPRWSLASCRTCGNHWGDIVVRTIVLALAAICVVAHLTGHAQAQDLPPSRIVVRLDSDVLVPIDRTPD